MVATFRSNISEILREQGRTNAWFYRRMGVSETLFYRIESGDRNPSTTYRRKAAELLGVPEQHLFLPLDSPIGDTTSPLGNTRVKVAS